GSLGGPERVLPDPPSQTLSDRIRLEEDPLEPPLGRLADDPVEPDRLARALEYADATGADHGGIDRQVGAGRLEEVVGVAPVPLGSQRRLGQHAALAGAGGAKRELSRLHSGRSYSSRGGSATDTTRPLHVPGRHRPPQPTSSCGTARSSFGARPRLTELD